MNGKRFAAVLLVVAALTSAFGLITWAQEPDGTTLPTNEYGTPDMSQIELTPAGHYEECVAYCTSVPVIGDIGVNVEYDLYSDNYGNTWVVPSPLTVLVTAVFPEYTPTGLANRTDGWAYGSLLMGMLDAVGGLDALGIDVTGVDVSQMGEDGIVDAIRDAADMEGDHLRFMLRLGQALAESGGTDGFLGSGLELWQISWLYGDNPFDPGDDAEDGGTPQPTRTPRPTPTRQPTPTPRPTATPMPTPVECPPESVSQQPPVAEVLELYPPNPVVQGQGGQGLDVTFLAVSYPAIHRWWTVEPQFVCKWWDVQTYGTPFGNRGYCCPEDNPDCVRDDYWMVPEGQRCVEHAEAIPDPILMAYLSAGADLRPGSIAWIESDLAQKYPGAHVRQPHLSAFGEGQPTITADGRCVVEAIAHLDFADPGYYDIAVHGQTAGTQHTPPHSFDAVYPTPQPVYLVDTILLR